MEEQQSETSEALNLSPKTEIKLSKDEYFRVRKIVMCLLISPNFLDLLSCYKNG